MKMQPISGHLLQAWILPYFVSLGLQNSIMYWGKINRWVGPKLRQVYHAICKYYFQIFLITPVVSFFLLTVKSVSFHALLVRFLCYEMPLLSLCKGWHRINSISALRPPPAP